MIFCKVGYPCCIDIIDLFSGFRKPTFDKIYPIFSFDLFQEHQVPKFVKWHRRIRKHIEQHMALTTIKAISNMGMPLPMRPQFLLKCDRIFIIADTLKFVNTHDNFIFPGHSDCFCKVKNIVWVLFQLIPAYPECQFTLIIRRKRDLWQKPR